MEQPTGIVTLLFTDIEGSTRLLSELGPERYRAALAEHRRVVREACGRYGGYEVDYEGDAFFVSFGDAGQAVAAACEAQRALATGPMRVRMGLHTGSPLVDPPKYVGMDVHLAARIMSAGHGGQVLLSKATRDRVETSELRDLGEHRVKDFDEPVWIFQLGGESFPPLKTISNTNLPRPASSFVGREREVAEVAARIREGARLVTLTGPAGRGRHDWRSSPRWNWWARSRRASSGSGSLPFAIRRSWCQPSARPSVQAMTWPGTSASGRCSC